MRSGSLSSRLLVVTLVWSLAVLVVAGVVLTQIYRQAVERSFDERLNVYLKALVASVASVPADGTEFTPGNFGEPRFDLPLSGWYWQIRPVGDRGETFASPSLFDQPLPTLAESGVQETRGAARQDYVTGPGGQRLRMVERRIDFGDGAVYAMAVAGDAEVIESELAEFTRTLGIALALLGIGVVMSTGLQVRWGLSPLKRIRTALADIRSGRAQKLEGGFPREIEPLAEEVNALIRANQDVVERARTHVGNLAHALKTPLSVITNEARLNDTAFAHKVEEQTAMMREQISHHLRRARAAARAAVTTEVTDVSDVVTGLARAMERIYRDRGLSIRTVGGRDLKFRGERQDLEEMLGNLVDNACKWAAGSVSIEAHVEPGADGPMLRLLVDDDGPGMAADARAEAMRRGQRLDETKPGSGLGLSIVADLADLYGGRFSLSNAPRGGLRAELVLPGA